MRTVADWRSQTTGNAFSGFDFADFAQEFLCRNPDYVDDYQNTVAQIQAEETSQADEMEVLARRWDLTFPLRSPCRCRRCARTVAASI